MVAKPKAKKPSQAKKAAKATVKNPGGLAGAGAAIMGIAQYVPPTSPWHSYLTIGGAAIAGLGTLMAGWHGVTETRSGS